MVEPGEVEVGMGVRVALVVRLVPLPRVAVPVCLMMVTLEVTIDTTVETVADPLAGTVMEKPSVQ